MKKSLCLLLFCLAAEVFAQTAPKNELVQFSGVVVTSDSLKPIPFVSILVRNTSRGTVSDYFGFFSFVAKMNDTIEFTAIGYKKATFHVPDTIKDSRCSLIQILIGDTILLKEALIYPWPTKEQFKEAFLALRVSDDDLERAYKNLRRDKLNYLAENLPMDGSMNFRNQMFNQQSRIYYAGQVPTGNWLNPIAWARFIEAWQNGEFKKKKYNPSEDK
jgi:hypothetical protein